MKRINEEERVRRLVKSYVSEILKENDGTGSFGIDTGGMPQWGGTSKDMYKVFIQPFADVVATAAGKTKELARKAVTVVQVAFETIMTTLFPFLQDSYDEIFDNQKNDIEKIRGEYKDVYDRTDAALASNDASVLAFLCAPGPAVAKLAVDKGPKAASGVLSVVTGGISDKYLDKFTSGGSKKHGKSRGPSDVFDSYVRSYVSLLNEEDTEKENGGEKKDSKLADVIGSKKFIDAVIKKSPSAGEVAKSAQEVYRKTLEKAFSQASSVLNAKSIDELEKIVGKKLKGSEKLKDIKPEERKTAEEELMKGMKKSMKEFYAKSLQEKVKEVLAAGIPEDNPFIVDYRETIQKIRSL
ncbi:MAG: hypothetical protein EBU33_02415 [Sphingobacteriia bacterium]|jgi:hypothetical protein|nr:hypothetical protein [Sphingobacteriia bacterium]